MFKILFLLFLIVPIVEIAILIQLSEVIGGWPTIVVVIITAYAGAKMVKLQGLQTFAQIQQKSASGQMPTEELFSGVCILISGVLLLTPGILTDVLGFLLLTPAVRQKMAAVLKSKIHLFATGKFATGKFTAGQTSESGDNAFTFTSTAYHSHDETEVIDPSGSSDKQKPPIDAPKNVIDGEFQRKD